MPHPLIQPEQADKLQAMVARELRFLNRLCQRMQLRRFRPDDPLWLAAHRARDSVQHLHVAVHYAGCRSGVGRPTQPEPARDTVPAPADRDSSVGTPP